MTTSTIFIHKRTQAVHLPADTRFPDSVKKVDVRIRGDERIIAPVESTWDSFFLNGPTVTDDFMSERAGQHQREKF
jgi:antitoxin VapB